MIRSPLPGLPIAYTAAPISGIASAQRATGASPVGTSKHGDADGLGDADETPLASVAAADGDLDAVGAQRMTQREDAILGDDEARSAPGAAPQRHDAVPY